MKYTQSRIIETESNYNYEILFNGKAHTTVSSSKEFITKEGLQKKIDKTLKRLNVSERSWQENSLRITGESK